MRFTIFAQLCARVAHSCVKVRHSTQLLPLAILFLNYTSEKATRAYEQLHVTAGGAEKKMSDISHPRPINYARVHTPPPTGRQSQESLTEFPIRDDGIRESDHGRAKRSSSLHTLRFTSLGYTCWTCRRRVTQRRSRPWVTAYSSGVFSTHVLVRDTRVRSSRDRGRVRTIRQSVSLLV